MITGLVGLTSLAVGATTSPWLVPPYLAAMAWLLVSPPPRRATAGAAIDSPSPRAELEPLPPQEAAAADEIPPGAVPKPKTGRGRGRKPRAKAKPEVLVEKTAATWVQVAPGKFLRVEMPVGTIDDSTAESEHQTVPPTESEAIEINADAPGDAQPPTLVEVEAEVEVEVVPEPIVSREPWRETTLITEEKPLLSAEFVDPPEPARLVAVNEPSRPIQPRVWPTRSARVRPDPRPKLRRGNGRVGAVPRVVLHRG